MKSNPRFVEPNLTANIEAGKRFRALAAEMGMSAAALAMAASKAAAHVVVARCRRRAARR